MKITISKSQWEGIGKTAGWFGDTFQGAGSLNPEQINLLKKLSQTTNNIVETLVNDYNNKSLSDNYEKGEAEVSKMIGQMQLSFKDNQYISSLINDFNDILTNASNMNDPSVGVNFKGLINEWRKMQTRLNRILSKYN